MKTNLKRILRGGVAMLFCLLLVNGCKKDVEEVPRAITKNKLALAELRQFAVGKTSEAIQWEQATNVGLKNGRNMLYVPITPSFEDNLNNAHRFLVVFGHQIRRSLITPR